MPSRLSVVKPARLKVTTYVPGRTSTILYCPSPSVTTVRTFSIRAGLAASTITPGSTAPDVSLTTPAIPLGDCCAHESPGRRSPHVNAAMRSFTVVRCSEGELAAELNQALVENGPRSTGRASRAGELLLQAGRLGVG